MGPRGQREGKPGGPDARAELREEGSGPRPALAPSPLPPPRPRFPARFGSGTPSRPPCQRAVVFAEERTSALDDEVQNQNSRASRHSDTSGLPRREPAGPARFLPLRAQVRACVLGVNLGRSVHGCHLLSACSALLHVHTFSHFVLSTTPGGVTPIRTQASQRLGGLLSVTGVPLGPQE